MAEEPETKARVDFFISYNSADLGWAEWIAWELEQAHHTSYRLGVEL